MPARLLTASGQQGETPCEDVLSGGDNAPRGVSYLVHERFGKYSDWETIRMSSLPKERYSQYRLIIMIIYP